MKLLLTILFVIATKLTFSQDYKGRLVLGEANAKEAIKKTIADKNHRPFYDTLIKYKKTAIAVAEPILYEIYSKKNIIDQRPYECYLIDGYWFISGTLPKNTNGGVFEIIISSRDGKVMKIRHGK